MHKRNNIFENVRTECSLLNRFSNEIRYPHRIEINNGDVIHSINAVERIKNVEPIKNLIETVSNLDKKN